MTEAPLDFNDALKSISKNAYEIDKSPSALEPYLTRILTSFPNLSNMQLAQIYGESSTLGFTLHQHVAAVERLEEYPDWQNRKPELWRLLKSGVKRIGLATTQLAKPSIEIKGHRTNSGYLVTGSLPWICGYRLFEYVYVGFAQEDNYVFAVIPFPQENSNNKSIKINEYKLFAYQGSAPISVELNDFEISDGDVVYVRNKNEKAQPSTTGFLLPEIGIAQNALELIAKEIEINSHPRVAGSKKIFENLKSQSEMLMKRIKNLDRGEDLSFAVHDFIRRTVRVLSIVVGSRGLAEWHPVARKQREISLLDVFIQPPTLLQKKIESNL